MQTLHLLLQNHLILEVFFSLLQSSFLLLFNSMARTKGHTQEGEGGKKSAMQNTREGQDHQEGKRGEHSKEEEWAPLSCTPPLPSQTGPHPCEGGGEDGGRG